MENNRIYGITAILIIGLLLSALILGRAIQRFRQEDRTISVKGFSEREVKSDLAVWTIRTRIATNDLDEGSKSIEVAKNKVIGFLVKNNIKQEEIIQKDLVVNDKKAQEYGNGNGPVTYRYLIDKIIQVRSNHVENIQRVSRMTDDLLRAGVIVTNNNGYEGSVKFYFTKLNDIKPSMLTEATISARNAAQQFARESGMTLEKLKKASQGLFTIMDRDEFFASQASGDFYPGSGSDLMKKVRVVVSIEYTVK